MNPTPKGSPTPPASETVFMGDFKILGKPKPTKAGKGGKAPQFPRPPKK